MKNFASKAKSFWLRLGVSFSMALGAVFSGVCPALAAHDTPGTINNTVDANGFHISTGTNGTITITPGNQVSLSGTDWQVGLAGVISKYKGVAQGILAICTVTALIFLIISIAKLSASSVDSMPMARRKASVGILVSGIALALFGGLSVVVGFFWSFLINLP